MRTFYRGKIKKFEGTPPKEIASLPAVAVCEKMDGSLDQIVHFLRLADDEGRVLELREPAIKERIDKIFAIQAPALEEKGKFV